MNDTSQKTLGSPEWESTEGLAIDDDAFARIVRSYTAQLTLPDGRPISQYFLCPIGLVGAGKSTILKPLAERLQLLRISTDEIRKLLKEQGYNQVRTAEIAYFIIQNFAKQGYSIAIDADCAGHNVAETIKKAAQSIGAQTIWIHINPPEEFILNKLKNYKHTWLFKDSDDALASYYRRKPLHEELDFPFAYTFDTSKNNVAEQIEDAASVIDALVKE